MFNDPAAVNTVGLWALNIFCSVAIIAASKVVLKTLNFTFATTLTAIHFFATASGGLLAQHLGLLPAKKVPWVSSFWLAVIASTSIVSLNLSLMLNSVGFYQVAKLSMIPTCCFLQWIFYGATFTWERILSMAMVLLGVGVCTVTDVEVRPLGFVIAAIAAVTAALQQIHIEQLQKVYSVGSFDLLSQTAPIQAILLSAVGPFVDFFLTEKNVFTFQASVWLIPAIVCSSSLSFFLNVTTYLCIGKFSAVTYQVLGNMKTLFVLVMGWLFFDAPVTMKNFFGLVLAVLGMVLYSWATEAQKLKEKLPQKAAPEPFTPGPEHPGAEETYSLLKNGFRGGDKR